MALATTALGVLVVLTRRYGERAALGIARLSERVGPEAAYRWGVRSLYGLSERLHGLELRNLRGRAAAVLLPTALLVGAGVLTEVALVEVLIETLLSLLLVTTLGLVPPDPTQRRRRSPS